MTGISIFKELSVGAGIVKNCSCQHRFIPIGSDFSNHRARIICTPTGWIIFLYVVNKINIQRLLENCLQMLVLPTYTLIPKRKKNLLEWWWATKVYWIFSLTIGKARSTVYPINRVSQRQGFILIKTWNLIIYLGLFKCNSELTILYHRKTYQHLQIIWVSRKFYLFIMNIKF